MVSALAFGATAVATLFAQATLARATRNRSPHEGAWAFALFVFALASAALAIGVTTGWDNGTFRAFYLLGAILSVPWLALGTVYLLLGRTVGRRVQWVLVGFSGLAVGAMLTCAIDGPITGTTIPVGREVLPVLPRVLAAVASGVGAIVIIVGALYSAARFARRPEREARRRVGANVLIAFGTLVLSGGGLIQGVVGKDTAFALSLALGISVIYAGFLVAAPGPRTVRTPSGAAAPDPDVVTPTR
ncbi:MAG: hypothetical protein ACKO72_07135 [Actinomycetes bacterium]